MTHNEFELLRCSRQRLANRLFIGCVCLAAVLLLAAIAAYIARL